MVTSLSTELPHTTSQIARLSLEHFFSTNIRGHSCGSLLKREVLAVDWVPNRLPVLWYARTLLSNRLVESVIGCGVGVSFPGSGVLAWFLSFGQGSCFGAAPYFSIILVFAFAGSFFFGSSHL